MLCPAWIRPLISISLAVFLTGLPSCFIDSLLGRIVYVLVVGFVSTLTVLLLGYFLMLSDVDQVTEALRAAVHERHGIRDTHYEMNNMQASSPAVPQAGGVSPGRRIYASEPMPSSDNSLSGSWEAQRYSAANRPQLPREHSDPENDDLHDAQHLHNQVQSLVELTKRRREDILQELQVSSSDRCVFELQGAAKDLIEICFDFLAKEERVVGVGRRVIAAGKGEAGVAHLRDLPPGTRLDDLARHSVSRRRLNLDNEAAVSGNASSTSEKPAPAGANGSEFAMSVGGASQINRGSTTILEVPFYMARGQRFPEDSQTICFYIERSKNANIVVYDCVMAVPTISGVVEGDEAIEIVKDDPNPVPLLFNVRGGRVPIQIYWLDKDPSFADPKRERGIDTNRTELNFIERRMAYGATQTPLLEASAADEAPAAATPDPAVDVKCVKASIQFVALPQRTMQLHMARCHLANTTDGQGCRHPKGAWAPVLTVTINSVLCVAEKAFVKSNESKHFWQLPTVDYIDLYGFSLEADALRGIEIGMLVVERIQS